MKNLVVGAGLTGAIIAERLASKLNEEVLVIDKAPYVGGMHYDYVDKETEILVQPRHVNILHTDKKYVWDYLNEFTQMDLLTFRPLVNIQGINATLPLCLKTLHQVFPEDFAKMLENKLIAKFGYNKKITIGEMHRNTDENVKFLANYFYENVFKPYTMKLWGVTEEEVPPCDNAYFPFNISKDDRYYKDKYQAIPRDGWTSMIENILKHRNIKLKLNTDFSDVNPDKFNRIFYTGSIDEYFDYKYGNLPYRSIRIELDDSYCDLTKPVYNFPIEYDFLRTNSYRSFVPNKNFESSKEILGFEYIEDFELGKNERFYPLQNETSQEMLEQYMNEAKEFDNLYFVGRLGEFKYYESDELVTRAFEVVAKIFNKEHNLDDTIDNYYEEENYSEVENNENE